MITGASSGLGEALAHTFYRCGCKIILVARRKEELERVKRDLIDISVSCLEVIFRQIMQDVIYYLYSMVFRQLLLMYLLYCH